MVDWVKQHVTCPFIIVRPEVVRNIHMRIDNGIDLLHRDGSAAKAAPPPLPVTRGRKVAICYSTHETGLALIAEAKRVALCPADTVYVVHVFDEEPVVRTHASALSFFLPPACVVFPLFLWARRRQGPPRPLPPSPCSTSSFTSPHGPCKAAPPCSPSDPVRRPDPLPTGPLRRSSSRRARLFAR